MTTGEPPGLTEHDRADDPGHLLAAIVASSDDAIIGKDLDGIITSWNRGAERIYGYTPDEVVGRHISILVPPEIDDDVPAILERLRRGERIDHYETVRMTKDGRRLHVSLTISPIRDSAGRIVGASKIARDITERKRADVELRHAKELAEAEVERIRRLQRVTAALTAAFEPREVLDVIVGEAIDAMGAYAGGVVELTPDGREFVLLHSGGIASEGLRPYARFSVDRPLPVRDVARTSEPVFIRSREEWNARYPQPPSADVRAGAWAALPLRAPGRLLGALTLMFERPRDFTRDEREYAMTLANQCAAALDRARTYEAERRAKRAAEEANRAKGEFLAIMSHELRTPLTAVIGYASLLGEEVVGPLNAVQRDQVARVRESGRHLLGLIEQILSLSRIEARRERIELEPFDVAALMRETADMVRPLAEGKRLAFAVDVPDAPLEIDSDRGKTRQILLNLLSNAIKFTDEGEVRLSLRRVDDAVVFRVADTGPGIAAEHRARIFQPFEQVDSGTTRAKGGTGLGLSVSFELARLLGGTLELESGTGPGSTFRVTLPIDSDAASPAD